MYACSVLSQALTRTLNLCALIESQPPRPKKIPRPNKRTRVHPNARLHIYQQLSSVMTKPERLNYISFKAFRFLKDLASRQEMSIKLFPVRHKKRTLHNALHPLIFKKFRNYFLKFACNFHALYATLPANSACSRSRAATALKKIFRRKIKKNTIPAPKKQGDSADLKSNKNQRNQIARGTAPPRLPLWQSRRRPTAHELSLDQVTRIGAGR